MLTKIGTRDVDPRTVGCAFDEDPNKARTPNSETPNQFLSCALNPLKNIYEIVSLTRKEGTIKKTSQSTSQARCRGLMKLRALRGDYASALDRGGSDNTKPPNLMTRTGLRIRAISTICFRTPPPPKQKKNHSSYITLIRKNVFVGGGGGGS